MNLLQAQRLWEEAREWPRCGEDWPKWPEEKAAKRALDVALGAVWNGDDRSGETCPICEIIGGYCGGSRHPACGNFNNGRPAPVKKGKSK